MPTDRTRLAPSPTGALHLGNARTFLVNWALARQRGWQIVLRIDDLDGPRTKPGADRDAIEILQWLGLDWDEGPYYQRQDLAPYQAALVRLAERGAIYPCRCTRTQIQAAALSAPHAGEHELRYPGTCRPPAPIPAAPALLGSAELAWRLRVPPGPLEFADAVAGPQRVDVQEEVGDFLVATKAGLPSYQLAVVVDDAAQGITQVVRGDDLLSSTARQLHLDRECRLAPPRSYWHLPLVVGPDGRRLAKRHSDSRVAHFRQRGTPPERIIGLLAEWCGLGPRRATTAAEFRSRFDLSRLPRARVVYTADDERWLGEASR